MAKCHIVLLVLLIILIPIQVTNGDTSNNTSSYKGDTIIWNDEQPSIENDGINNTIIVDTKGTEKSKVTIKIYKKNKKNSGFEIILVSTIIMVVYMYRVIKKRKR